jgi:hypothetical protein
LTADSQNELAIHGYKVLALDYGIDDQTRLPAVRRCNVDIELRGGAYSTPGTAGNERQNRVIEGGIVGIGLNDEGWPTLASGAIAKEPIHHHDIAALDLHGRS